MRFNTAVRLVPENVELCDSPGRAGCFVLLGMKSVLLAAALLGEVPALTARGIPPTGTENYGGPMVTAAGLISSPRRKTK